MNLAARGPACFSHTPGMDMHRQEHAACNWHPENIGEPPAPVNHNVSNQPYSLTDTLQGTALDFKVPRANSKNVSVTALCEEPLRGRGEDGPSGRCG
jgi:hypothetical protein